MFLSFIIRLMCLIFVWIKELVSKNQTGNDFVNYHGKTRKKAKHQMMGQHFNMGGKK